TYYTHPQAFTFGSRMIKKFIAPMSIKRAERIITDSENTKKDIIGFFPKAKDKIRVIYPGSPDFKRIEDQKHIEAVKANHKIAGKYILYMGTLEPRKNLIRLIEAYHKLVNEEKIEQKLVLAGKKGWLYNDIFSKIVELHLEEQVIFTDYISEEDKSALYSGAEVFAYPSLYEGFGLPPLEAMACGTAVVTSNISSLPEVVGNAGIYINPYDVENIAQGIYSLLINQELRRDLENKGIEQAKSFSWNRTVKQIIDVYKEILE
ncbi:MAG: glycosyltransferase family 1 protein, partial [Thermotaleaceae bacterium]